MFRLNKKSQISKQKVAVVFTSCVVLTWLIYQEPTIPSACRLIARSIAILIELVRILTLTRIEELTNAFVIFPIDLYTFIAF